MLNSTWLGCPIMALNEEGRSSTRNLVIIEWQSKVLWTVVLISMSGRVTMPNVGMVSRLTPNVGPKPCLTSVCPGAYVDSISIPTTNAYRDQDWIKIGVLDSRIV